VLGAASHARTRTKSLNAFEKLGADAETCTADRGSDLKPNEHRRGSNRGIVATQATAEPT